MASRPSTTRVSCIALPSTQDPTCWRLLLLLLLLLLGDSLLISPSPRPARRERGRRRRSLSNARVPRVKLSAKVQCSAVQYNGPDNIPAPSASISQVRRRLADNHHLDHHHHHLQYSLPPPTTPLRRRARPSPPKRLQPSFAPPAPCRAQAGGERPLSEEEADDRGLSHLPAPQPLPAYMTAATPPLRTP